ncbi:MAG: hypothetical protein E7015_02475, partial [Alphaproteobacteria bacterium]|nr:hypothetical protein [Alphaproteobacteria bacterium]
MKKLLSCVLMLAAEAVFCDEDVGTTHKRGAYVGMGLVCANDKYDLTLNRFLDVDDDYSLIKYQKTSRNYSGEFFVGYQVASPIFAAVELGCTLNSRSAENYFIDPDDLGHDAVCRIKYGNDLSLKLKIGKVFKWDSLCRQITPYIKPLAKVERFVVFMKDKVLRFHQKQLSKSQI